MAKQIEPEKIAIHSAAELHDEFAKLQAFLDLAETEHTWEKIDKAVRRFQAVVRGGGCRFTKDFVDGMRAMDFVKGIVRSIATERTRLSATALDLVASVCRLELAFAPLLALYGPHLLRLLCRTNKLYIARASATISSIITHTRPVGLITIIVGEWRAEAGKSSSFRIAAAEAVLQLITSATTQTHEVKDKYELKLPDFEWLIKTAATDREAKVRATMKTVWDIYKREWPDRVPAFTAPWTPTIRRYLAVPPAAATAGPAPSTSSLSSSTRAAPKPKLASKLSSSTPATLNSTVPRGPSTATASRAPVRSLSASAGPSAGPSRVRITAEPTASKVNALTRSAGPSTKAPPPPTPAPIRAPPSATTTPMPTPAPSTSAAPAPISAPAAKPPPPKPKPAVGSMPRPGPARVPLAPPAAGGRAPFKPVTMTARRRVISLAPGQEPKKARRYVPPQPPQEKPTPAPQTPAPTLATTVPLPASRTPTPPASSGRASPAVLERLEALDGRDPPVLDVEARVAE